VAREVRLAMAEREQQVTNPAGSVFPGLLAPPVTEKD
jgi:hypothetical protein